MADTTSGQTAPMPLLYRNPRPLSAERHKDRLYTPPKDFRFASGLNSVVVCGNEFPLAQRFYPIVFTAREPVAALAVLGLQRDENLFVDETGAWAEGAYVPAYVRRYPFIFMEGAGDQLVLCIDEESSALTETEGQKLFDKDQPTPLVAEALRFSAAFHKQAKDTTEFARALDEHKLLVENTANVTLKAGRHFSLSGFRVIDERKFNELPNEVILDWRKKGWLALVYCHLLSMANWNRLSELAARRIAAAGAADRPN